MEYARVFSDETPPPSPILLCRGFRRRENYGGRAGLRKASRIGDRVNSGEQNHPIKALLIRRPKIGLGHESVGRGDGRAEILPGGSAQVGRVLRKVTERSRLGQIRRISAGMNVGTESPAAGADNHRPARGVDRPIGEGGRLETAVEQCQIELRILRQGGDQVAARGAAPAGAEIVAGDGKKLVGAQKICVVAGGDVVEDRAGLRPARQGVEGRVGKTNRRLPLAEGLLIDQRGKGCP